MPQEQLTKYLVDKLEYEKNVSNMAHQNKVNQAKMIQEKQKFDSKTQQIMQEQAAQGILPYQSTNQADGYNYPLIDVFANIRK